MIVLQEWRPQRVTGLDRAVVDALLDHENRPVEVTPERGNAWTLRATSKVGVIRVGDVDLRIQPKVGIENMLRLMDEEVAGERWFDDHTDAAVDDDLLVATIRRFAHHVSAALNQGLRRDYRSHEDHLVSPRGRIDFPAQFARPLVTPLACRFDEYTADIELNRLLRHALLRSLAVSGLPVVTRRELMRAAGAFDDTHGPPPGPHWFPSWKPNRLERHWVRAARLADVILRQLSSGTDVGAGRTQTFLIDMNVLFEQYVTRKLGERLPSPFVLRAQHEDRLDVQGRVVIKPDIVIFRDNQPVLALDCKYKLSDGRARHEDYYQALAYATALNLDDAALIYHADDDVQVREPVVVRHRGVRLHTWPVDLRRGRAEVDAELDRMAQRSLVLALCRRLSSHVRSSDANTMVPWKVM